MRTSWHDLWGSARGPAIRLAPQSRLLAGAGLFAACMIPPAHRAGGTLLVAVTALACVAACRPPLPVVRSSLMLGLTIFLPYFLLAPLLADDSSRPGAALAVPWSILVRGLAGMLISISTAASLTASDLREGLGRLPVPRLVAAILLQIVHQTGTLFYETRRIASAMAVRGASTGTGAALRMLASLPRAWLPRVIVRAERVAAVMELRGYCDGELHALRRSDLGLADAAALALVASALVLAVAFRAWSSA
jgi:hypothetical protein